MKSKAAAARQGASQTSKAGNQREAGLRAAMLAPLSSSLGNQSKHPGGILLPQRIAVVLAYMLCKAGSVLQRR